MNASKHAHVCQVETIGVYEIIRHLSLTGSHT